MKVHRPYSVILDFGYSSFVRNKPNLSLEGERNTVEIPFIGQLHRLHSPLTFLEVEQTKPSLSYLEDLPCIRFPLISSWGETNEAFFLWILERGEWVLIEHASWLESGLWGMDEYYNGPYELDEYCEKKLMEVYGLNSCISNVKNMSCDMLLFEAIKQAQTTGKMQLDFSSKQISTLPSEIGNLNNLVELDLSNNYISVLPQEIGQLVSLTKLNLANNALATLPTEVWRLYRLKELNISSNKLTALMPQVRQLTDLTEFHVEDNPLKEPPPEIVKQGLNAIREYFRFQEEGNKRTLNEVKLLLVGDGRVGKTSLAKCLVGEQFDENESQTHGINIKSWLTFQRDQEIKVRVWDFGGQEILHTTHQFFLSKRSLYILVLDETAVNNIDYWLKYIETFGGDSPILVVINKIDRNPGLDVDRFSLAKKHKGIKGFFPLSCATKEGVDSFISNLTQQIMNVELVSTSWAQKWFNVKAHLEAVTKPFISYQDYRKICETEGLFDESTQDILVEYLHDLGVILHFRDLKLLDTYILEPRWVTNAVYKIINSEELAATNGVLELRFLDTLFKRIDGTQYNYPREKYRFIIDLMIKFELCYELASETILVPDLLEAVEPSFDFEYATSLKFVFQYNFLPKSVISRFITRMHQDIMKNLRWRTGVVLEDKSFHSCAVIKADAQKNTINIFVINGQSRDYFAVIRKILTDINNSFEKTFIKELIPLPGYEDTTVEYTELIGHELAGKSEYFSGKLGRSFSVQSLLNGIERPEHRKLAPSIINNIMNFNTDGGTFINGSVTTGGDFIGRDKTENRSRIPI